jgi:hypothetical protein
MSPRVARAAMILAAIGTGAAVAPPANASLVVTVSIDGTQVKQFSGTNVAQFTGSLSLGSTVFSGISIAASSNAGTSALGTLAQTSMSMMNSTGSGTLKVDVAEDTPFISPGAPGGLSGMQSTVFGLVSGAMPLTFQSFVTTATNGSPSGTYTWGLQKFDATQGIDASPNSVGTTFVGGTSYTLHNVLTLQAGGTAMVGAMTFVTPEPPTLAALISGLPVVAIGARRWLSRRRNRKQP